MGLTTSEIFRLLKPTLREVLTDKTDNIQRNVAFTKFCNVRDIEDAYVDDTEIAGPGLVAEKPEGTEIALGQVKSGFLKRYTPGTFALKLTVTKEAQEDNKYTEAVPFARFLKKSMWTTADVIAALMLARATNTTYPGGDGVPLASASHTLPHGGTFSNTMATPMSPSNASLAIARAALTRMPDLNGIISPLMAKKVVFPVAQESLWDVLLGSAKSPEAGQFNAINIAYKMNLEPVRVHHWTNTDTNWALISDAENGLNFMWRIRPQERTWMDNDNDIIKFAIRGRFTTGWTNARGIFFVDM
jgi:hypothetical protein